MKLKNLPMFFFVPVLVIFRVKLLKVAFLWDVQYPSCLMFLILHKVQLTSVIIYTISLYVRIYYLAQTLTPQSISLYARISMPETPINSLSEFHLICEPTCNLEMWLSFYPSLCGFAHKVKLQQRIYKGLGLSNSRYFVKSIVE